jgi:uncharacterized protein with PIN domain
MQFIVTAELGRLITWLRILGFDTTVYEGNNLRGIVITSLREERIILSRNRKLGKRAGMRVVQIKSGLVAEQVKQVLKDLNLQPKEEDLFSRCVICNVVLEPIQKEKVKKLVPPYVFKTQEVFITCSNCHKIYWKGTHWGNAQRYLKDI